MSRPARLATLLLAFGISAPLGCGGDNGEDEVRAVARLWADSRPARCQHVTKALLRAQYDGSVKACREDSDWGKGEKGERTERAAITGIVIEGDKAEANVKLPHPGLTGSRVDYGFVKKDGEWRLFGYEFPDVEGEEKEPKPEEESKPAEEPKIREGLSARATVEAYYQTIAEGDGAALCGLLSEREATDVLNEKRKDPIGACVEALAGYDWSNTRKRAARVEVVKVARSGDTATVTLSSGRRALLEMQDGRWVIDDFERRTASP